MKNRFFMPVLIAATLSFANAGAGEPYAPKLKQAPNLPETQVPDKDEVGISPYPGALVAGWEHSGDLPLPYVDMMTADEVTKVVAFYEVQMQHGSMKGWKHQQTGSRHEFWQGGEFPDPLGGLGDPTPAITISVFGYEHPRMPEAKTRILIYYEPVKEK